MEWVHVRRATWSTEPLDAGLLDDFSGLLADADLPGWAPPFAPSAPVVIAPPPVLADVPPVFEFPPPPPDRTPEFDAAALFVPEPVVVEAKKPRPRPRIPIEAIRSFTAPLISGARRVAPAAAMLAVVVGAGWMATPYLGKLKTWATELTEEAPPAEPEPVVAKPAASRGSARTGQLTARSDPPGATVLVDGRERGVTPLTLEDLPIGSHTVVLQSEKGSVRRTVTVASGRAAVVSEAIFAGWLTVFAPFELQITDGARVIRLDEGGKVLLAPGPHDLRLENRDLGYQETRRVEVQPGQTTSLSVVASPSTLSVTSNSPATVSVDGQQVGDTPLVNQPIALGTRDIVVKAAADGTERRFTRKVTVTPVQIDVDFSQP